MSDAYCIIMNYIAVRTSIDVNGVDKIDLYAVCFETEPLDESVIQTLVFNKRGLPEAKYSVVEMTMEGDSFYICNVLQMYDDINNQNLKNINSSDSPFVYIVTITTDGSTALNGTMKTTTFVEEVTYPSTGIFFRLNPKDSISVISEHTTTIDSSGSQHRTHWISSTKTINNNPVFEGTIKTNNFSHNSSHNYTVAFVTSVSNAIGSWAGFFEFSISTHIPRDNGFVIERIGTTSTIGCQTNSKHTDAWDYSSYIDTPVVFFASMEGGTKVIFRVFEISTGTQLHEGILNLVTKSVQTANAPVYIGMSSGFEATNSPFGEFIFYDRLLSDRETIQLILYLVSEWKSPPNSTYSIIRPYPSYTVNQIYGANHINYSVVDPSPEHPAYSELTKRYQTFGIHNSPYGNGNYVIDDNTNNVDYRYPLISQYQVPGLYNFPLNEGIKFSSFSPYDFVDGSTITSVDYYFTLPTKIRLNKVVWSSRYFDILESPWIDFPTVGRIYGVDDDTEVLIGEKRITNFIFASRFDHFYKNPEFGNRYALDIDCETDQLFNKFRIKLHSYVDGISYRVDSKYIVLFGREILNETDETHENLNLLRHVVSNDDPKPVGFVDPAVTAGYQTEYPYIMPYLFISCYAGYENGPKISNNGNRIIFSGFAKSDNTITVYNFDDWNTLTLGTFHLYTYSMDYDPTTQQWGLPTIADFKQDVKIDSDIKTSADGNLIAIYLQRTPTQLSFVRYDVNNQWEPTSNVALLYAPSFGESAGTVNTSNFLAWNMSGDGKTIATLEFGAKIMYVNTRKSDTEYVWGHYRLDVNGNLEWMDEPCRLNIEPFKNARCVELSNDGKTMVITSATSSGLQPANNTDGNGDKWGGYVYAVDYDDASRQWGKKTPSGFVPITNPSFTPHNLSMLVGDGIVGRYGQRCRISSDGKTIIVGDVTWWYSTSPHYYTDPLNNGINTKNGGPGGVWVWKYDDTACQWGKYDSNGNFVNRPQDLIMDLRITGSAINGHLPYWYAGAAAPYHTTYDVSGDGTKIVIGAHDKNFYTPSNPESGYFFTYLFEYNPATHQWGKFVGDTFYPKTSYDFVPHDLTPILSSPTSNPAFVYSGSNINISSDGHSVVWNGLAFDYNTDYYYKNSWQKRLSKTQGPYVEKFSKRFIVRF